MLGGVTGFLCPSPLLASGTASQNGMRIDGSELEALEGWESGNLCSPRDPDMEHIRMFSTAIPICRERETKSREAE